MLGHRDKPDSGDELSRGPVRQSLEATRGYGCLLAILIGGAMSFVIFLGNIMGDCPPGPRCHHNDGVHIMKDLAVALPMAAVLGAVWWFAAAAIRAALKPLIGEQLVILLLVALTLALVWFGFNPAMETFFGWTAPNNS